MKVTVNSISPDPAIIIKNVIDRIKNSDKNIKINENKPSEIERFMKKLIREKNYNLARSNIHIEIEFPYFVYLTLTRRPIPFDIYFIQVPTKEYINFETSENFTDTEEASLSCLFKKVKNSIQNIDNNKIKYFLPLSCQVTVGLFLDILTAYEFLSILLFDHKEEKIQELFDLTMTALSEKSSVLFNKELFDIYEASENV